MTLRWKIAQAAEIRWWQRYLKNKPTADYAAWKRQYWRDLLTEIGLNAEKSPVFDVYTEGSNATQNAQLTTHHSILDAGCGPAGIFMVFKNAAVDALDPLLDSYEATLPHFKKSNFPNVRFFSKPLESFVAEKPYDAVFCLNAINHVADLSRCFDVLVGATKRGGTLVISIDAHNFPFLKRLFQALPGDILHPHQYDLAEYMAMLTERGCRIERVILKKHEFIFNYYVLVATKN